MRPLDRQAMALVVATLVLDQLSKHLLLSYLLKAGAVVTVIDDFFRLVVVWNRGVSFGLLGGDRPLPAWLLSGVAIAVCVGLFIWLRRTDRSFTNANGGLPVSGRGDFSVVINDSGIDATHPDLQFGKPRSAK